MSLDIQTGFKSIFDVVDREIENLAILFGHSEGNTWQAMCFQINQINRRTHRIHNLPTLGVPEDERTLDPGYLGESGHSQDVTNPGNPITRIETNFTETIQELGYAVEPDGIFCWAQNPGAERITGVQGERLRGLGPGSDSSMVYSEWTKTVDGVPTTALSPTPWQGLVRIDSSDKGRNNIYVGFENNTDGPQPLGVLVAGVTYRVSQLEGEQLLKDVVFGNGYKRRVLTWGGFRNDGPNLPKGWSDNKIKLTGDDVRTIMRGGGKA